MGLQHRHTCQLSSHPTLLPQTFAFEGDLSKPSMPNQFIQIQINGPELTSDDRRIMYENWLLVKGFQDLEILHEHLVFAPKTPNQVHNSVSLIYKADAVRAKASGQICKLSKALLRSTKQLQVFWPDHRIRYMGVQDPANQLSKSSVGIVSAIAVSQSSTLFGFMKPSPKSGSRSLIRTSRTAHIG